jgi:hypothetical protein
MERASRMWQEGQTGPEFAARRFKIKFREQAPAKHETLPAVDIREVEVRSAHALSACFPVAIACQRPLDVGAASRPHEKA